MANTTVEHRSTERGYRPRLMSLTEVIKDERRPWATSKSQLYRLCASGQLRHRRLGKSYWVSEEDLDAYEDAGLR